MKWLLEKSTQYRYQILFVSALIALVLFHSTTVLAQEFITCNGPDCSACNLVDMGNTLLVWIIGIGFVFFAVIAVVAGFGLVTSGGNPSALQAAKDKFINAFIGLIIILAAWLLVDTIMQGLLTGSGGEIAGYGPWSEVQCQEQFRSQIIAAETNDFAEAPIESGPGSYRAYVYDAANSCRTMQAGNYGDVTACQSVFNMNIAGISPSNLYVEQYCSGNSNPDPTPSWYSASVCGIPDSPAGQQCYPGSGSTVCFPTYTLAQVQSQSNQYNYSGGSPPAFIDTQNPGGGYSASTRISQNYSLSDLNMSGTCGQGGRYVYINPTALVGLEQIVSILGSRPYINSGFRSPGCNVRVGGATNSQHMQGIAYDIAPPGGSGDRCRVVQACRAANAGFIMTYNSTSHVHCDWGASRGEDLTISC